MGTTCSLEVTSIPWAGTNGDGRGSSTSDQWTGIQPAPIQPPPVIYGIKSQDAWLNWWDTVFVPWEEEFGEEFKERPVWKDAEVGTTKWKMQYEVWWEIEYRRWWIAELRRTRNNHAEISGTTLNVMSQLILQRIASCDKAVDALQSGGGPVSGLAAAAANQVSALLSLSGGGEITTCLNRCTKAMLQVCGKAAMAGDVTTYDAVRDTLRMVTHEIVIKRQNNQSATFHQLLEGLQPDSEYQVQRTALEVLAAIVPYADGSSKPELQKLILSPLSAAITSAENIHLIRILADVSKDLAPYLFPGMPSSLYQKLYDSTTKLLSHTDAQVSRSAAVSLSLQVFFSRPSFIPSVVSDLGSSFIESNNALHKSACSLALFEIFRLQGSESHVHYTALIPALEVIKTCCDRALSDAVNDTGHGLWGIPHAVASVLDSFSKMMSVLEVQTNPHKKHVNQLLTSAGWPTATTQVHEIQKFLNTWEGKGKESLVSNLVQHLGYLLYAKVSVEEAVMEECIQVLINLSSHDDISVKGESIIACGRAVFAVGYEGGVKLLNIIADANDKTQRSDQRPCTYTQRVCLQALSISLPVLLSECVGDIATQRHSERVLFQVLCDHAAARELDPVSWSGAWTVPVELLQLLTRIPWSQICNNITIEAALWFTTELAYDSDPRIRIKAAEVLCILAKKLPSFPSLTGLYPPNQSTSAWLLMPCASSISYRGHDLVLSTKVTGPAVELTDVPQRSVCTGKSVLISNLGVLVKYCVEKISSAESAVRLGRTKLPKSLIGSLSLLRIISSTFGCTSPDHTSLLAPYSDIVIRGLLLVVRILVSQPYPSLKYVTNVITTTCGFIPGSSSYFSKELYGKILVDVGLHFLLISSLITHRTMNHITTGKAEDIRRAVAGHLEIAGLDTKLSSYATEGLVLSLVQSKSVSHKRGGDREGLHGFVEACMSLTTVLIEEATDQSLAIKLVDSLMRVTSVLRPTSPAAVIRLLRAMFRACYGHPNITRYPNLSPDPLPPAGTLKRARRLKSGSSPPELSTFLNPILQSLRQLFASLEPGVPDAVLRLLYSLCAIGVNFVRLDPQHELLKKLCSISTSHTSGFYGCDEEPGMHPVIRYPSPFLRSLNHTLVIVALRKSETRDYVNTEELYKTILSRAQAAHMPKLLDAALPLVPYLDPNTIMDIDINSCCGCSHLLILNKLIKSTVEKLGKDSDEVTSVSLQGLQLITKLCTNDWPGADAHPQTANILCQTCGLISDNCGDSVSVLQTVSLLLSSKTILGTCAALRLNQTTSILSTETNLFNNKDYCDSEQSDSKEMTDIPQLRSEETHQLDENDCKDLSDDNTDSGTVFEKSILNLNNYLCNVTHRHIDVQWEGAEKVLKTLSEQTTTWIIPKDLYKSFIEHLQNKFIPMKVVTEILCFIKNCEVETGDEDAAVFLTDGLKNVVGRDGTRSSCLLEAVMKIVLKSKSSRLWSLILSCYGVYYSLFVGGSFADAIFPTFQKCINKCSKVGLHAVTAALSNVENRLRETDIVRFKQFSFWLLGKQSTETITNSDSSKEYNIEHELCSDYSSISQLHVGISLITSTGIQSNSTYLTELLEKTSGKANPRILLGISSAITSSVKYYSADLQRVFTAMFAVLETQLERYVISESSSEAVLNLKEAVTCLCIFIRDHLHSTTMAKDVQKVLQLLLISFSIIYDHHVRTDDYLHRWEASVELLSIYALAYSIESQEINCDLLHTSVGCKAESAFLWSSTLRQVNQHIDQQSPAEVLCAVLPLEVAWRVFVTRSAHFFVSCYGIGFVYDKEAALPSTDIFNNILDICAKLLTRVADKQKHTFSVGVGWEIMKAAPSCVFNDALQELEMSITEVCDSSGANGGGLLRRAVEKVQILMAGCGCPQPWDQKISKIVSQLFTEVSDVPLAMKLSVSLVQLIASRQGVHYRLSPEPHGSLTDMPNCLSQIVSSVLIIPPSEASGRSGWWQASCHKRSHHWPRQLPSPGSHIMKLSSGGGEVLKSVLKAVQTLSKPDKLSTECTYSILTELCIMVVHCTPLFKVGFSPGLPQINSAVVSFLDKVKEFVPVKIAASASTNLIYTDPVLCELTALMLTVTQYKDLPLIISNIDQNCSEYARAVVPLCVMLAAQMRRVENGNKSQLEKVIPQIVTRTHQRVMDLGSRGENLGCEHKFMTNCAMISTCVEVAPADCEAAKFTRKSWEAFWELISASDAKAGISGGLSVLSSMRMCAFFCDLYTMLLHFSMSHPQREAIVLLSCVDAPSPRNKEMKQGKPPPNRSCNTLYGATSSDVLKLGILYCGLFPTLKPVTSDEGGDVKGELSQAQILSLLESLRISQYPLRQCQAIIPVITSLTSKGLHWQHAMPLLLQEVLLQDSIMSDVLPGLAPVVLASYLKSSSQEGSVDSSWVWIQALLDSTKKHPPSRRTYDLGILFLSVCKVKGVVEASVLLGVLAEAYKALCCIDSPPALSVFKSVIVRACVMFKEIYNEDSISDDEWSLTLKSVLEGYVEPWLTILSKHLL